MLNNEYTSKIWLMIPARGGSKGIPRKNLRLLGNRPLILHTLTRLAEFIDKQYLIVSTEDEQIASVCAPYATIHHRSAELASDKANLDEVTVGMLHWLVLQGASGEDIILTVQPTSPFLSESTVRDAIVKLEEGARSVITVTDDRHLRWTVNANGEPQPLYEARVNRQWLPPTFSETGGLFGARIQDVLNTGTRINPPIQLVEIDEREAIDIDDYNDWAIAEFQLSRLNILLRADAGIGLGMGHVYRALALAQELSAHELRIATRADADFELGAKFLSQHPYNVELLQSEAEFDQLIARMQPDILILDILDTEAEYMLRLREYTDFLVTLENLGSGVQVADIVINDLYSDLYPQENHWYGVENAILSPYFETVHPISEIKPTVERILVTFGGTDPQNFTHKSLEALQLINFRGEVRVVVGPGYQHGEINLHDFGLVGDVQRAIKNMAEVGRSVDLALTSAGRTVTELMTLGLPMIVMCQNLRELRHTHASSVFGVINLGLGEYVDTSSLAQHINLLLKESHLRLDMHQRALKAVRNRSNVRIVERILAVAASSH